MVPTTAIHAATSQVPAYTSTDATPKPIRPAFSAELTVNAPIADVWSALSTSAGLSRWMAPVVEIDLREGGTVRSWFLPDGPTDDQRAVVASIRAFHAPRMLTLATERVPATIPFADALTGTWGVFLLDEVGSDHTRITSAGYGYPEALAPAALAFFTEANEGMLELLRFALEPAAGSARGKPGTGSATGPAVDGLAAGEPKTGVSTSGTGVSTAELDPAASRSADTRDDHGDHGDHGHPDHDPATCTDPTHDHSGHHHTAPPTARTAGTGVSTSGTGVATSRTGVASEGESTSRPTLFDDRAPVNPSPGLGRLADLIGGTWTLSATWSNGDPISAQQIYEPMLAGRFLRSRTVELDPDGRPTRRYESILSPLPGSGVHGAPVECSLSSFAFDGSTTTTRIVQSDADTFEILPAAEPGTPLETRQQIHFLNPDTYLWTLWTRRIAAPDAPDAPAADPTAPAAPRTATPRSESDWTEAISATWQRTRP